MQFPSLPDQPEPPMRKMTLREYTNFSYQCLLANPEITPENCMTVRTDEAEIKVPFRMRRGPDGLPTV